MRDAVRRLTARPSGTALLSLGGVAALVLACRQEPIPAARDTAASTSPVASASPSLAAVLDSLPTVPTASLTGEQRRGRTVFATLCVGCHGPYGHGDGPTARGFARPLPDLGRLAVGEPSARLIARMQAPLGSGTADSAAAWHAVPAETLRLAVAYLRTMSPGSRGNAATGRLLYATYCVQCHGVGGRGDGRLAAGFSPQPANLHSLRLAGREEGVLATIAAGGPRDHRAYMPNWSLVLTDEQLGDLVAYISVYRTTR